MLKQIAFIDEYGTPSLNLSVESVTSFYILTSVLVSEENIISCREKVAEIRKRFFQTGEIKSKNIGTRDGLRIAILRELISLPIKVFSIAIDKSAIIPTSGLIYKKPFIKYINGILYRKLFKTFPAIEIFADAQGSPEFQISFQKYIQENHMTDLFRNSDINLISSKDDVLIQVADLFAGSIARKLDPKKQSEESDTIFDLIRPVLIAIDIWPLEKFNFDTVPAVNNPTVDMIIQEYCVNQAKIFIASNIDSPDETIQLQVDTLKYLLFRYNFDNDYNYITTDEILDSINSTRITSIKEYFFRSKVIAELRECEVIIAGSNRGLKIPTSYEDLQEHTIQTSIKVMPMMRRIIKARNQIRLLTKNEIDLFSEDRFNYLKLVSEKVLINS